MGTKPVSFQYRLVIATRPNAPSADAAPDGGQSDAQDTPLFAVGSYNRPPGAGEVVFTNELAALRAGYAALKTIQIGLGQNARLSVYGKICGTAPAGNRLAAANVTPDLTEKLYINADVPSAGLHDMVKYMNSVPSDSETVIIRELAGPEVVVRDGTTNDPAPDSDTGNT